MFANRHGSQNMYNHIKTRGFTLVELVVTLSLVTLLAGLAQTSWTQLLVSNRHRDLTQDIQRMFATARSHAIHSKTLTTICPLSQSADAPTIGRYRSRYSRIATTTSALTTTTSTKSSS